MKTNDQLNSYMNSIIARNPGEPEFHQAVHEVMSSVYPYVQKNPQYLNANILARITEPDRIISFRVAWEDDKGNVQVNRGYRVQFNNAIGPYKGGIRFHPTVTQGVLKFLGFEQVFKNSLTTLPMGGGKGGADFDPHGKSDREVMRFCQSFMSELSRHIGADTDVPAGDIGVGGREVGYMFGAYKKIRNEFTGVFTGKGVNFGGSLIRPEATGYGCVYFVDEMLKTKQLSMKGKSAVVSGSGNVAQYAAEKLIQLGAKVLTLSDSSGFIFDKDGINEEKLAWVMELKNIKRGRLEEYAKKFKAEYTAGKRPWGVSADLAFPCATQNELDEHDALTLLRNKVLAVGEGANMPSTLKAVEHFRDAKILFGPGKAANAGGVSVSGLEMSQNSLRLSWTREEVDNRLRTIMSRIHDTCVTYGTESPGYIDYVDGANIGGFIKVADAMLAQGVY
jgi:glutamate dehydrogenase/leucine dehydrogenase